MAKKSRTPAPPRAVQAPKRRTEPRDPRRRNRWLAVAAGALLLAAAAGGIAYAVSRGSGGDAEAGACRVQTFKSLGRDHVPPGTLPEGFEYNSYPPTSGPHHPEPLVWGEYTEPVPQDRLVHNLEHGGVAIQYGKDVSEETVARLTDWFRIDPRGMVLAPLPDEPQAAKLVNKIVLGAWVAERQDPDDPNSRIVKMEGKLATCSRFDEDAFTDFIDDYRARGPEAFPLENLQPGSQ